jgi:hypothetical protein
MSVTWEARFAIVSTRQGCWEVRLTICMCPSVLPLHFPYWMTTSFPPSLWIDRISDSVEARQPRGLKLKLKGYVFDGTDRSTICAHNTEVSYVQP